MNCPSLVNLGYEAFSLQLHEKVFQERIPVNGSFEMTMRCNLRCEHCYIPFSQRAGPRQGELTLAEIQRIFGEIAEAGCLWLLLTGGEPLLRSDFLEVYAAAKRSGFILSLFTNGTLLTEKIADYLAEYPPFSIEISLYGATRETYERVTGIPGSFERCLRGIELLQERKLPLRLKSVLLTLNQHELIQMKHLSESLGLKFGFDPVINAGIDGSLYPTQFRLSPEQIVLAEQNDPERSQSWPEEINNLKNIQINSQRIFNCGAGRSTFHIDASGKLCMCISFRTPNYDLRQGSFQEGWYQFLNNLLDLEYSPSFACSDCELRTMCPMCPALSLTELGDMQAKVPFACQVTHLRQAAFDRPMHT